MDFDDSNSNTYGARQLTLFNDYYHEYCYMPLFVFEGNSGKLVLPILRPGRPNKRANVTGLMIRLIEKLRQNGRTPSSSSGTRAPEQKAALKALLEQLKEECPETTVHGHNEFSNKACPCFDVKEEFGE